MNFFVNGKTIFGFVAQNNKIIIQFLILLLFELPTNIHANEIVNDSPSLKVGLDIRSTHKVPLTEVLKPLAHHKKFSISFDSCVNQEALVDIDIRANDSFFLAIENILRQLDYFFELKEQTLIIKCKKTRVVKKPQPTESLYNCAAEGGRIEEVGDLRTLTCVKPYADAGKPCNGGDECISGSCIAPPHTQAGSNTVVGYCKRDLTEGLFGCYEYVTDNKVEYKICAD